jgi:hypothetical protein
MMATEADAAAFSDESLSGAFRIDRDGVWHHEGVEVTHPGVLRNLYANLREDGEAHYLQVGPRRVPVQIDDAPFVVVRAEVEPSAAVATLHLSDGSQEPLETGTLVLDPRGVPYCRVKAGQFRARFSIAAWLQLADRVEDDSGSAEPVLVLGARRFPLRRAE